MLLALLWLGSTAYAQAVPKTKTKNRKQQGMIMSDSPNTIAPATPAERNANNHNMPRTEPSRPEKDKPVNSNTRLQNPNSLDDQPLNGNSNGRIERNPDLNRGDLDRSTNDILNNSSLPAQPPPMSK